MLPLPNIDELNRHLLRLPKIVDSYEARDPLFLESAKTWLREAEEILENNRLPLAGSLAALRGGIISAERGNIPGAALGAAGMPSKKARQAVGVEALREGQSLISGLLRDDLAQIGEAERLLRQIIGVARSKRHIDLSPASVPGLPYSARIGRLWEQFSADAELAQGIFRVVALVGSANSFALFERQISALSIASM